MKHPINESMAALSVSQRILDQLNKAPDAIDETKEDPQQDPIEPQAPEIV